MELDDRRLSDRSSLQVTHLAIRASYLPTFKLELPIAASGSATNRGHTERSPSAPSSLSPSLLHVGELSWTESLGVRKRLTENLRSRVTGWGAMRRWLKRQVPTSRQVAPCSARCVMTGIDSDVGDRQRWTDGVPAELSSNIFGRILQTSPD